MQTTIAQTVACVTYGNAFLLGLPDTNAATFYPAYSTFVFCEYVKFVTLQAEGNRNVEVPNAADPMTWFKRLKEEGITK